MKAHVIELDTVDSTNQYLARLARSSELSEGTVAWAKEQTEGRGQRGAIWYSRKGRDLPFSWLLFPSFLGPSEQFLLNKVVSLAIVDFLKAHMSGRALWIKWPNDILVGRKKIVGILIENALREDRLLSSVVGVGMNLGHGKEGEDLPEGGIALGNTAWGGPLEPRAVLNALLGHLEQRYSALKRGDREKLDRDYSVHLFGKDQWLDYRIRGERRRAMVLGVDLQGKLILRTPESKEYRCAFKEVAFLTDSS